MITPANLMIAGYVGWPAAVIKEFVWPGGPWGTPTP